MPALTGPALVVAALLAIAGAQKVLDPAMTQGALGALGLPASRGLVRAGAAAELILGAAAIGVGGGLVWGLVALSYLAFAAFVVVALRKGTMLGSCGCFGREDTPPHPSHVALNVILAAVAVAAMSLERSAIDELAERPGSGAVVVALVALSVYLLQGAYVALPRALSAGRAAPGEG